MTGSKTWIIVVVLSFFVGCSSDDGRPPMADASADGSTDTSADATATDASQNVTACIADRQLRECTDEGCETVVCRTDEWCEDAQCLHWSNANFTADFELSIDAPAKRVEVEVADGGFPREFVEALRFDFADGVSGFGERVDHAYATGGVYPIELVVRLVDNRTIKVVKPARVAPSTDHNPLFLTVNQVPEYMNGSQPVLLDQGTTDTADDEEVPIHLQVVRDRFIVDVAILEAADPVVPASIVLEADVALGEFQPGDNLIDQVVFDASGTLGTLAMTTALAPPEGMVTLTFEAETEGGTQHTRELRVEAVELTPETDPFDRPHVWLFRTDTDFFTTQRNDLGGTRFELLSTQQSDGEPDFVQELRLMGALGDDEELNERYLNIIKGAIRTQVYRYFGIASDGTPLDGIELEIVWDTETGAPNPSDFSPTGELSMMRLGGFFEGYIGFSRFAPYNEERVDDSTEEYGVASAAILSTFTSFGGISDAFAPIHPQQGAPLGEHTLDEVVLAEGFDRFGDVTPEEAERFDELQSVARYIGLSLASVIAHEMGHAMGLMPDGLPPTGYFGGRSDVSFVGASRTNRHHADLPGINLMQAGGDNLELVGALSRYTEIPSGGGLIRLAEILALETQLSPLSRAYLQRRLTHGTPD